LFGAIGGVSMKRLPLVLMVSALLAGLVYLQASRAAPALREPGPTKWEYKTLRVHGHNDIDEQINELGEGGWEYAGFGGEVVTDGPTKKSLLLFKRPRR
jgi:hypothetical protein